MTTACHAPSRDAYVWEEAAAWEALHVGGLCVWEPHVCEAEVQEAFVWDAVV